MAKRLAFVFVCLLLLAGAGYSYLLSKKDGVWVIQADTMVWIS